MSGHTRRAMRPLDAWRLRRVRNQRLQGASDKGISNAKADGRYRERPASIDAETVKIHEGRIRPAHLAKHLRIGRDSVSWVLDGTQAVS